MHRHTIKNKNTQVIHDFAFQLCQTFLKVEILDLHLNLVICNC